MQFSSPLANRCPVIALFCEGLACIQKLFLVLALLLWFELRDVNVGFGTWGFRGPLETIQSPVQPYTVVPFRAWIRICVFCFTCVTVPWSTKQPPAVRMCLGVYHRLLAKRSAQVIGGTRSTESVADYLMARPICKALCHWKGYFRINKSLT